jgi:hypothetical protein
MKAQRGCRIVSTLSLISVLEVGGCGWVVNAKPRPLYHRERDLVAVVQEVGWAPGPVWTAAEDLAPTGIRCPERPAPRKCN